jgi:hypothetical protein
MDLSGMKKVGADGQPEDEEQEGSEKTFLTKLTSLPWWVPLIGIILFELDKDHFSFKRYTSPVKRAPKEKLKEHISNCERAEKLGLLSSQGPLLGGAMRKMSWKWGQLTKENERENESLTGNQDVDGKNIVVDDDDFTDRIQDIFHHPSQEEFFDQWKNRADYKTYHPPFWLDLYQHIWGAHPGDASLAAAFLLNPILPRYSEPAGESEYDFRMWVTNEELRNPKMHNEMKEAVAVDWKFPRGGDGVDEQTKLVVLLHGLNGDSREEYVRDYVIKATAGNCACCVVNARGMGGEIWSVHRYYSYTTILFLIF